MQGGILVGEEIMKKMEANKCHVTHSDADAHLPPRKRLLAGLKRQTCKFSCPAPSTSHVVDSEDETCLSNLLKSELSTPNLSNEEIVEASRCAAIQAANVAEAARANAEIKAAQAAKAMAAAKSALDRVATLSEEAADREKNARRNKIKKHVTVEALYNKIKMKSNARTDEELARKLHQVINSSPRTFKNSSGSDSKNHKHKRLKSSASFGSSIKSTVPPGEEIAPSRAITNGNSVVAIDEVPVKDMGMNMVNLNTSKPDMDEEIRLDKQERWHPSKTDQLKLENGAVEPLSFDKFSDSSDALGKKRGKIKQKKLPLSICSFRDQSNPKEDLKSQAAQQSEFSMDREPLFSPETSGKTLISVEGTSLWKCQAFKVPTCVAQNKVMQS